MPAFTSFLNLYKPGGGSTGLILPDEVVDIDRINANMDLIDAYAAGFGKAANRNHQFYGPAASIGGVTGMKLGDTYQESDGNKVLWKYDGSNWVTGENGMYLIRPTSVVNATVGADGAVIPNASVSSISVNGVFTTRYRDYLIRYATRTGTLGGATFLLRAGGVDHTSDYRTSYLLSSSGTPTSGMDPATNSIEASGTPSDVKWGSLQLLAPAHTTLTMFELSIGVAPTTSSAQLSRKGTMIGTASSKAFDGFTHTTGSGTFDVDVTRFKVYGLA